MISVLIADDHPLYRAGVRLMLEGQDDVAVVADAETVSGVLESVSTLLPDVVVLDVGMPGGDGIDAVPRLIEAHPDVAILVVTMHDDQATATRAMRSGARGYLVKGASGDDVLRAVRAVAAGQYILDGQLAGTMLRGGTSVSGQLGDDFTDRERDILRLMAGGLTNTAIAEALFLSDKTVRNYVSSIFHKTGAANRVEAVVRARQAGWT